MFWNVILAYITSSVLPITKILLLLDFREIFSNAGDYLKYYMYLLLLWNGSLETFSIYFYIPLYVNIYKF